MNDEVRYLMTQKQLNRYKVISMAIEGKITIREAAESLGLSGFFQTLRKSAVVLLIKYRGI